MMTTRFAALALCCALPLACTVEKSDGGKAADAKAGAPKADAKTGAPDGKGADAKAGAPDGKGAAAKAKDAVADAKAAADAKADDAKADADKPQPIELDGKTFTKGMILRPGATAEELIAYAKAQGDPAAGVFTLEDAFEGDPDLADPSKGKLMATFKTTMGEFQCALYEDKAPKTVANFVGLARGTRPSYDHKTDSWSKRKYFDDVLFHRVIKGFMIQTGDPTGTGTGTPGRPEPGKPALPGYAIEDEFDKSLRHTDPGMLSMANRGKNTGGSQFFVTVAATKHLDDKHAIFGKCEPEIPTKISEVKVDPRRNNRPYDPVKIESIEIFRKK